MMFRKGVKRPSLFVHGRSFSLNFGMVESRRWSLITFNFLAEDLV